ncbi:MAG: chromosome partitioning protein ParA, partial [Bacteroidota bacterium]|nr:chromosome partitioning protein ParA [Bacteroidota bacterium]
MAEEVKNTAVEKIHREESSVNLADIWKMFWNYKWWYLLSLVLCFCLAQLYLYKTPPTYQASAKVIIDEDTQSSTMRDLTNIVGSRSVMRGGGTNVDNEIEAFSSPDLMQVVVERLGLETSYSEHEFLRERERYLDTPVRMHLIETAVTGGFSFTSRKKDDKTFELSNFMANGKPLAEEDIVGVFGDTLETPVGRILMARTANTEKWNRPLTVSWTNAKTTARRYCSALDVSPSSKQSSVIVLSLKDRFPLRGELILSTLLDVYDEVWIENKNKATRNSSQFINDRLIVIEKELGGIENSIKDYKSSHQLTNIESLSQQYLQESSQYATRNFEVSNQLSIAKAIRDRINDPAHADDLIPGNTGLESSAVTSQIDEYNKIILERDRMMSVSSASNPLVVDMNNSLDALRVAIGRSIDNLIATLQMEYDKIEAQEKDILRRIASTSGQELELLSIERQQKVKETLYTFLLQKREENELQSNLTVGITRTIVRPSAGNKPVSPNNMMIYLVAFVLGLGIPFAIIYLARVLDTTVKSRNDLARLSVPFLAEVPQLNKKRGFLRRLRKGNFDHDNTAILVQSGKRDMINESFRVVRTTLDTVTRS